MFLDPLGPVILGVSPLYLVSVESSCIHKLLKFYIFCQNVHDKKDIRDQISNFLETVKTS